MLLQLRCSWWLIKFGNRTFVDSIAYCLHFFQDLLRNLVLYDRRLLDVFALPLARGDALTRVLKDVDHSNLFVNRLDALFLARLAGLLVALHGRQSRIFESRHFLVLVVKAFFLARRGGCRRYFAALL